MHIDSDVPASVSLFNGINNADEGVCWRTAVPIDSHVSASVSLFNGIYNANEGVKTVKILLSVLANPIFQTKDFTPISQSRRYLS